MTADYQPTTVKLHPLKKTTAMNIKFSIGKNKKQWKEREWVTEGTRERMTVEKIYNYHTHIYIFTGYKIFIKLKNKCIIFISLNI